MKKTVLLVALAFGISGAFAQTLTSKKGEPYLPEAGDWAIQFSATPFLNYAGNLFNSNANAPTANFLNQTQTIIGKYYKDEKTAYRGLLRIGFGTNKFDNIIPQDPYTGTAVPAPTVTDEMKISHHFIGIGAGMEKRKGKTRLQGYYGAELMFYIAGSDTTYTYGNAYSSTNQSVMSTTNFMMAGNPGSYASVSNRTTESKAGSTFGLNLLGFIGAEYFVFPKISIGAEYDWGLMMQSTGEGTTTTEMWNNSSNSDTKIDAKVGKSKAFGIDTGINDAFGTGSGSLNITLHF